MRVPLRVQLQSEGKRRMLAEAECDMLWASLKQILIAGHIEQAHQIAGDALVAILLKEKKD